MGMGNPGGSPDSPYPGFPGPGAGDLAGRYRKSGGRIFTQQNGTVQDLISEGEIEGLVGGASGVYLNETPISNSGVVTSQGSRFGLVSTTATTTTINSTTSDLFTDIDLAAGLRVVQIQGAEHQTTLASAASAGATSITVTNAFTSRSAITWVQSFVKNSLSFANITIAGAGPDGDDYVGTLVSVTGTSGTVSPALSTSVSSGATVEVDFFSPINTVVDGDTIGTAQAVPVSVTNAAIQILPPVATSTADGNFSNTSMSFYKGTRTQAAAPRNNAAAVSFIHAPSTPELQQSTDTLGSGSVSIVNSFLAGTSQPTQSPRTFTASIITGGASSDIIKEIDTLSVEFELPSGLGYFVQDGDFQEAVVEIQIAVEFDRGGNTEEIIFINQNTKLNGSNQFVRQRGGLANPYPANFVDKIAGPGGLIIGETQGSFLASYSLDLTPYQPFDDFTLKIARISPEIFDNYTTQKGLDRGENALLACNIKTIQAGIFEKLSYPNSAYAVTQFSAEDFDTPPTRAYHIRGKKVKVPSNYITREELNPASPNSQAAKYTRNISTGVDESSYQSWDGSFRGDETLAITHPNYSKVYTNNPAWIFYDILTNKTYGLGDFLNEEDIDIYSLYQIARYCDELVPDGKGGLEPRFACNVYITSQQESYKVLKDLASCFRGMMYWIDGEIVGVQDRPKEPVYTFTQGNVIDGLFSYEYTGQRARINQVNVTWNDPEQFYRQSVVTVDDFDNVVEQNRLISKDVVAFGCTSEGQATRVGRWHLLTDTQETEIVKFQTSINAGFLRPGDWIKIQDAKADNVEFSGRVSTGSTTTSIELDRDVVLQAGQTYNLYLIYPEAGCYLQQESATINSTSYVRGDLILTDAGGSPIETSEDAANLVDDSGNSVFTSFSKNSRLEKKAISSTGTVSTLAVSSAFSSAPGSDVIWAVSNVNEQRVDAPVTYRILGISEDAPNLYSIVGAKVITEKYDELEKKWAVYVDPYKPVASKDEAVPAPSNLKVEIVPTPGVDADSSGSSLRAIVSWNEPTETFVDSNGTTETTKYRFIDSYEIQHSFYNSRTTPITALSAGRNSITFDNINTSGEVIFRIRTRNTSGQRSPFVSVARLATPSQAPSPTFDRLSKIVLGGQINSPIAFNTSTGLIEISNSNYLFVSSIGKRYDVVGATTAQSDIDFSSLSSGDTGYWYFDFSDTSDPWKTMIEHTDTTVENTSGTTTNFSYWKELGASNNGLTLATGTVSLAAGSDEVTGVSTSFTTDFAVGDLIKLSTNNTYTEEADAEYFEVAFVQSDTKLFVRRNATKTFSGDYAYKQSFKPDFINDNILASVTNTAGTFSISYFVLKSGEAGADGADGADGAPGEDGLTIVPTNATHAFLEALDGTIDYTSYSCEFDVAQGDTAFTYDGSGTPAADTFSLTVNQQTNITASIDGSGVVTVSNMTDTTAEVAIEVTINDTSAVFREILTFVLVEQAVRGSGTFTFEESTTPEEPGDPDITPTDVQGWTEDIAFTNTHAQNVADAVIAASSDGFIRPNDKITVTDNSADLAGTRIYTGSAQASSGSIQTSNFSSLVVETFDGSVIVDGTLSAEKLLADSTFTQNLVVGASFELNSSGKIYSTGKNTFADTDAGFFLGYDGGAYKFNLGNASNYLKWDGTDLEVAGDLTVGTVTNPADLRSEINVADGADVTSANTAAGIAGQGALATQNSVDFASQVSGSERPEPNADVTSRRVSTALINADFEAGAEGWALGSGWSIVEEPANARRGDFCLSASNVSVSTARNDTFLQVEPGDRVLAQGFAFRSAGTGGLRVRIEWRDAAGAYVSSVYGNTITSASYAQSRVVAVAPAGASFAALAFVDDFTGPVSGRCDGAFMAIIPKDEDIDALEVTNGPIDAGATAGATWGSNVEGQPADGGQNLVRDPRFDLSSAQGGLAQSSYWTSGGTGWSITSTDGQDGGPAALFGPSSTSGYIKTKYRIPIVPGERFYGQLRLNPSAGFNGTQFRLEMRLLNKNGGTASVANAFPDLVYIGSFSSSGWQIYSGEVVIPSSYTSVRYAEVWLTCNQATAGTLAVDDVYFGRASRGADTSGDTFTAQAGLLPNQNLSVRDSEQKPAGIYPVQGAVTDRSRISFETYSGTFGLALDGTGTTTVAAFPAIAIDDRFDYKVRIRHASSGTSSTGYYLRFNELNTYPGSGKTHIGFNTFPFTATKTSIVDLVSNGAVPGTSWVENEYDYTPTLGTKWASFSIYAWSGFSGVIYVDYVAIEPETTAERGADVTSANTAAGIAGQGALATLNSADFSTQVSGTTKPADNATNNGSTVDSSGNIVAPIELSGTGTIKAGKTAWNTGTGWLLEFNGGTPRFDIGNPAGNKLQWDGTNLTVAGTISVQNPSDVRTAINVADGADVTSANTAAAIAGQGALATQNSADFGSQVTGATKPANNATNNGTTVNTSGNIAGSMTMISGGSIASGKTSYGSGTGWILEYNAGTPRFDLGSSTRYLRWNGTSLSVRGDIIVENAATVRSAINVADGADVTSANTAAGIAGQGALATQNSADFGSQVTGATKPANNATNNGTTINTSGNIAGSMTMISGGSIIVGNITIDGTNSRILITD